MDLGSILSDQMRNDLDELIEILTPEFINEVFFQKERLIYELEQKYPLTDSG